MDRLETRELSHFVAVAEELHFSRAAERLGMAQPPLSRSIARLERRIGVQLLERTSRRVTLTPAGAVFLEECRHLLNGLDVAVGRTRQAARQEHLVIAVRPGAGTRLLHRLLRTHDGLQPEIMFTYDRAAALHEGTADLALLCLGSDDLTGLHTVEIAEEEPVALLPNDHALAHRATVTTADLRTDQHWREDCPPVGLDEILDRVALGELITVVGAAAAERLSPGVTATPVTDVPATILALGWPERLSRPEVTAFVRHAQRLAAAEAAPRSGSDEVVEGRAGLTVPTVPAGGMGAAGRKPLGRGGL